MTKSADGSAAPSSPKPKLELTMVPRDPFENVALDFVPPEGIVDERLPGGKGELFPLRNGQVLLVAHYPGDTTEEAMAWIAKACRGLVDDGLADAAVYVPEGWKLQPVFVKAKGK